MHARCVESCTRKIRKFRSHQGKNEKQVWAGVKEFNCLKSNGLQVLWGYPAIHAWLSGNSCMVCQGPCGRMLGGTGR